MRERRSPTPAALRKREAIQALKTALADRRVELRYQPIALVGSGEVVGAEALLRWRDQGASQHALTDLVWAAERSPVIFKLENWILEQAFAAAAGWQGEGLAVRVNVNVSAREFPRANLVRRLTRLLKTARLDARQVGLEITETSAMRDLGAVAEQLERLIALGLELWLDDFGTGHSSLDWLRRLPVHGLKIAGTFVEPLLHDRRSQVIVTRLIGLAHDLGLRVIAEGVENEGQREFLAGHGCDLLQGFLLHPALPASALPAALAHVPADLVRSRP